MKIFAISVLSLLVVLAVAGCSPMSMDDTRCYVTGIMYTDATETTRAVGIGVETTQTQESYVTETNANGVFWIEIQFYPEAEGGAGSIGSSSGITGSVEFGLRAFNDTGELYYYGGNQEHTFTVMGGDTLTMYSINLNMFTQSKSGGR